MKDIRAYGIFDKVKGDFWRSKSGNWIWDSEGLARSAWNNRKPVKDYPELILEKKKYHNKVKHFREQDIFEIVTFVIQREL